MLDSDAQLLEELISLLNRPDAEIASAAALVIGRLKPDQEFVVPALEAALTTAPPHLAPYVIDALAQYSNSRVHQRLIALLEDGGTLREQASALLERMGCEALPALQQAWRQEHYEHRSALVRIFCSIPEDQAVDFVFEYLETANYEQSRHCYLCLKPYLAKWNNQLRAHALSQATSLLKRSSHEQVGAKAAALRILGQLADEDSLPRLLEYCDQRHDISVRFAALESLRSFPMLDRHHAAAVSTLSPILDEPCDPALRAIAFKILREFKPSPFSQELLTRLSASEYPEVAKLAIRELPQTPGPQTLKLLMDAIHRPEPAVQSAAVAALGQLEGATESLIAASQDPKFRERADLLRAVLDAHGPRLSAEEFEGHFNALLSDEDLRSEQLVPRVLALSALNRDRTNHGLEQRAASALKLGQPEKAMHWLEPLVKHRLATPNGRYLLAKAHMVASELSNGPSDPHWIRAFQLLGPLGRLQEFHLLSLLRDDFISDLGLLQRVTETWSQRSEREKTWAEWLRSRLPK